MLTRKKINNRKIKIIQEYKDKNDELKSNNYNIELKICKVLFEYL